MRKRYAVAIGLIAAAAGPCIAETLPNKANCDAGIARAHLAAKTLPAGSMARRFADSDLVQAHAEGGNGEFDDCLEFVDKALDEAHHPQHSRAPFTQPQPHR